MFNIFRMNYGSKKIKNSICNELSPGEALNVNKLADYLCQPEFLPLPSEVVLVVVALEGQILALHSSDDQSYKVLPLFTEHWLAEDFIKRFSEKLVNIHTLPYTTVGFINALSMYKNKQFTHITINPCPDCKITNMFLLNSLKSPENLHKWLALEKAARLNTLICGLGEVKELLLEKQFEKAGQILASLENHNRLLIPELYHAFFLAFSGIGMEDAVNDACRMLGSYNFSWANDLLNWWSSALNKGINTILVIPAEKNIFGMILFDCRPFTLGQINLQSIEFMARFFSKKYPDFETVIKKELREPFKMTCRLVYPGYEQGIPNGQIFTAPSTYFRWHLYYYEGIIYFVEALTNEVRLKLFVIVSNKEVVASEIEASGEVFPANDPFVIKFADFCIKKHIFNLVVPHPLPPGTETQNDMINNSLRYFGSAGLMATIEDTTCLDTAELIRQQFHGENE